MSRPTRFLFGLWMGTSMLAYLAACGFLYLATGKFLVPGGQGIRLVGTGEAVAALAALKGQTTEQNHE